MISQSELNDLREKAEQAPELAFDSVTESGRFYSAASPGMIICLTLVIERLRAGLQDIEIETSYLRPNSGHGYLQTVNQVGDRAKQTLAEVFAESEPPKERA